MRRKEFCLHSAVPQQSCSVLMWYRQLLEGMFEWLVPPMLRVATRMVRAPVPMQDLNLVASCMRLLDALLVPEFRDKPQLIAEMNDNVQMVRSSPCCTDKLSCLIVRLYSCCHTCCAPRLFSMHHRTHCIALSMRAIMRGSHTA